MWFEFSAGHKELMRTVPDVAKFAETKYVKDSVCNQGEEIYFEYKLLIKSLLSKFVDMQPGTSTNDEYSRSLAPHSQLVNVKLPKVNIPLFSGKYSEWKTFRDLFQSLVHSNNNLGNAQKLLYLKGYLQGEPEQLLSNISISDDNYDRCWNLLEERYNNKRYICHNILKRLLSQRNIYSESASSLKELIDTTNDCLSALLNIGIDTTSWDVLIIHIITLKLDPESRRQWEFSATDTKSDELPKYKQFEDFLKNRYRAIEFLDSGSKSVNRYHNNKVPVNGIKTLHIVNYSCPFCKEEHKLYSCGKFSKESVDSRREFVASNNICFCCLWSNHSAKFCHNNYRCRVCKRKHHVLLHPTSNDNTSVSQKREGTLNGSVENDTVDKVIACTSTSNKLNYSQVLLATALVNSTSNTGKGFVLRELLDQGSQSSFITEAMVQLLGLKKIPVKGQIIGVGGSNGLTSKAMVEIEISSRIDPRFVVKVKAYVLGSITSLLPSRKVMLEEWKELNELIPGYYTSNGIDLLLGSEVYSRIIQDGVKRRPQGSPLAQCTSLGWILSGVVDTRTEPFEIINVMHCNIEENQLLKRFWELEDEVPMSKEKMYTDDERRCEEHFAKNTSRDEAGRYIVRLPFKEENVIVDNSLPIAEKRLQSLERRLKNGDLKQKYTEVIKEYIDMGHMEPVPMDEIKNKKGVYLPHHAIIRDDKETTKVRVVFDASCKGRNGLSLNDNLLVGPTLQSDLRHIVMRWRSHYICLSADIIKMYRQVKVHQEDADCQKILWRDEEDAETNHYRLTTVTFGVASAPYLAVKSLQQVALDEGQHYPVAAEKVLTDFYMDDLMTGCETVEDGKRLYAEMSALLAADCLHLQLYRDPKDRYKKGQTKASLSLQHFLGFESGFTLDKESNTIAIICQDVTVVLAFETRERLIAWQVKVGGQLGSSKEFLVMIGGGSKKLPAGPARLHLQGRRFALTSGVPPRLLGLWELANLRRYGVVDGRFCFEGGSLCGKGEGLHLLITDQAQDITHAFDMAARGNLSAPRTPASRRSTERGSKSRPHTRLSDLNTVDPSIPDTASGIYEENFFGGERGGISPFWPSDERQEYDEHDMKCANDIDIGARPPWNGADHVTLERCNNCLTKLGVMSRSSTVALTPTTHFNPAWTMEAVPESSSDNSSNGTEYLTPRSIRKTLEACHCKEKPPLRPPKPAHMEQKKPPAQLPTHECACSSNDLYLNNPKVGPYENYDVPKTTHTEVDNSEYYDTPKRIKQALADDLFQVTDKSGPGSLVLKKNCGCILKFGSKKKPLVVECDESLQPVECPCQKVTNWANNLISLPYCKKSGNSEVNTEVLTNKKSEEMAIYATVDVSRKTNRQSGTTDKLLMQEVICDTEYTNYQNIEPKDEKDFEGPYANYENLEFALSLEYYENAKDLLKKAGVTQSELDAMSANIDLETIQLPKKSRLCGKCGHTQHEKQKQNETVKNKTGEYLLMEPTPDRSSCNRAPGPNPGYTPMSPNPNWSQSLKHPLHKMHRVEIEKSLSIPTLNGSTNRTQSFDVVGLGNKEPMQKRSSSVDSARLLEDLKEFDSSIGSHATSSSLETLRNLAIDNRRSSSPCDNETECYECCKSSGSENKTSQDSSTKEVLHLRNKLMDNAEVQRSPSVPCKSGGNRDSSSSNDSGVSSCSMKHGGGEYNDFEMPLTSAHSRYQYMIHRRMRGHAIGCLHSSLPRKSKSSDPLRDLSMQLHKTNVPAKSSSAEAEVPVLPPKQFKGVMDTHSTSSGTSDMSDYIETLSLTSSHSSSDTTTGLRMSRQPTSTLRPRSGKEYHNMDPILTSMYKSGKELANYTNLP